MRIVRWLMVSLLIVIIILAVTPGIMGMVFQKKYQHFLTFVNSQKQVKVNLIKYQRGWFHSHALLQIDILNPVLRNQMVTWDLPQLVIGQTIEHGPIIYHMPPQFLLAAVHNYLKLTPENKQKLLNLGISPHETQFEDLFSFSGRDTRFIQLKHIHLFFPDLKTSAQAEGLQGHIAVNENNKNIRGKLQVNKVIVGDNEDSLLFSNLFFSFDQTQNENALWLGKINFSLPLFSWRDKDNHIFSLSNVEILSKSNEQKGLINGYRNLQVKEIQFDANKLGPLHINISIERIDAKILSDMVHTYKNIISQGELYRSQLENKMVSMLPDLFRADSKLKINNFDLSTPWGSFQLQGEMSWPVGYELENNNFSNFLRAFNIDLHFRISKMLANDFIKFVTSMPMFYRAGPYEPDSLAEARNDFRVSLQQNLILISSLVEDKKLPLSLALQLINSQKNDSIKSGNYFSLLKTAFLKKQIDRDTTYFLYLQFSQITHQLQLYSQQLTQFQVALAQRFRDQITDWVKSGYVSDAKDDYVIAVSRLQGNLKINGKAID